MSDPKVEEIRARLAKSPFTQFLTSDILAQLDEAEERERTLIAEVGEAHSMLVRGIEVPWDEADGGWGDIDGATAILSRLLTSTPTEEGTNDE